jgi:hypothetical protein
MNERLGLTDTAMTAVSKLSEGNPGALRVCMELLTRSINYDPDMLLGGIGSLLQLDSHGIYGSRIWMFYKDFCGEKLDVMVAMLRAVQLGIMTDFEMNHAIDNYGGDVDIDAVVAKVMEKLPNFKVEQRY